MYIILQKKYYCNTFLQKYVDNFYFLEKIFFRIKVILIKLRRYEYFFIFKKYYFRVNGKII